MKSFAKYILSLLPLVAALTGCEKSTTIGSSLTGDVITVTIDSSFTVTGKTERINKIQSRTVSQLIGRIDANGYGSLSSDVVTQFMPASKLDTENIKLENIDSLLLIMAVAKGEYIGDSIVPMGLEVYPLNRQLPSPIYSDFNPEDYYSPDNMMASTIYNLSNNTSGINSTDGSTRIIVRLPLDFARNLYSEYLKSPSTFASPTAFAEFFPGFYIKNSFGGGRLARVTSTLMTMYYHYSSVNASSGNDTTLVRSGNYFAVTPEIITNNNINLKISPEIDKRVDAGEHIVMAPVGLEVNMRFPAPEIIAAYRANTSKIKVLNSCTFTIPGGVIENEENIPAPRYLLMILSKDKDKFFANNSLPDNITSFYATYNSTTGYYSFGDMSAFIKQLLEKSSISEEDYTFTITPVSATFETSTSSSYYSYYYGQQQETLSMLTPYAASPVLGKLDLNKAKIRLTFSSQSLAD